MHPQHRSRRRLAMAATLPPPRMTHAAPTAPEPGQAPPAARAHRVGPDLSGLNPRQRQAVLHGSAPGEDGPLLVIAGAGTGKTNTLAHRVAALIARGADPAAILLLTFSRRAAVEMTRRVQRHASGTGTARDAVPLPWAGTFHAIAARLLREYAGRIGIDASFTIHDREDSADLMNLARHEAGLSATHKRFPAKGTCLAIYSKTVNTGRPLGDVLADGFPWCAPWEMELRALFAAYVDAKQAQDVLDYDDLLLYWAGLLQAPALQAEVGARFSHVLVDEYQDTNRLQADILRALKPDGRGLTVVGDDAQAIYAFRGATVRNILDFPRQFEPPATIVTLEMNYRSTQPILDACNAVIGLAPERFTKNLFSERRAGARPCLVALADDSAQARYVADEVLALRETGVALRAQAVLFRTSSHSLALELELGRRNVPFVKFGGLKFLETAHVKDLLACLRWAENLRDRVAGLRTLLLVPGIGPKTASRTLASMAAAADPLDVLARWQAPAGSAESVAGLVALLRALAAQPQRWPQDIALARRWLEPHLLVRYDQVEARVADLAALESVAATYPSRAQFLTDLTLDPPAAVSDEADGTRLDDDYLVLSTIHSAKGQEWSAVYLLNAVDGCIPSDLATGSTDDVEEERRLLYVAMTRAREHLHVVVPQRFYVHAQAASGDRHVHAARTRFIPAHLEGHFERRCWPQATGADASRRTEAAPVVDLAARMRAAWR
jgi:DNA helicase-2/ATP-dependent DNA helicase PcrA